MNIKRYQASAQHSTPTSLYIFTVEMFITIISSSYYISCQASSYYSYLSLLFFLFLQNPMIATMRRACLLDKRILAAACKHVRVTGDSVRTHKIDKLISTKIESYPLLHITILIPTFSSNASSLTLLSIYVAYFISSISKLPYLAWWPILFHIKSLQDVSVRMLWSRLCDLTSAVEAGRRNSGYTGEV